MSWDKQTRRSDVIDELVQFCKDEGLPFHLEVLGTVADHGNSFGAGPLDPVPIRRLVAGRRGMIYREQMQRAEDCDIDDSVIVLQFGPGDEPAYIPFEVDE